MTIATIDTQQRRAIEHLLASAGALRPGEQLAIVHDPEHADMAAAFAAIGSELQAKVSLIETPAVRIHGTEPSAAAASAMLAADLALGLTTFSLAHTHARRLACESGTRYLSLPEYSWYLLTDPSLLVDYRKRSPVVRQVADAFTAGKRVHITTALGTDIHLDIEGRVGNYCPGCVEAPGSLGSPPDIEANVSPVEMFSHGVVVVDGSIPCPQIGLLPAPVRLAVRDGRIVAIDSDDDALADKVRQVFAVVGSDKAYVLAECGVGLNEAAQLTGVMLTDEGAYGCLHFGFGSNATVGGTNDVGFHLDFVFRNADLRIDDQLWIKEGKLCR